MCTGFLKIRCFFCNHGCITKDDKMIGKYSKNCNASVKAFDFTKHHSEKGFQSLGLAIVLSAIAYVFLSIISVYPTCAANVEVTVPDNHNEPSSQSTNSNKAENGIEQNTQNKSADDTKARKELDDAISPGNVDAAEHEPTGTDARPGSSLTPETQQ